MLSDKRRIRDLVELCYAAGLREVVLSPGSRNAPLIISFTGHGGFRCHTAVDERSAAFMALGMSQANRTPTILCSTSGTAVLNYAPAIAEAYYQLVPLLVLTADRPPHLIDIGDGQTLRQYEIYRNYIRLSLSLLPSDEPIEDNIRIASTAIEAATTPPPGPVHLNIPLDEPLYGQRDYSQEPKPTFKAQPPHPTSQHSVLPNVSSVPYRKIMMLWGSLPPDTPTTRAVEAYFKAADTKAIMLSETTSNTFHPQIIPHIDRTLAVIPPDQRSQYAPELLITFGHNIVSKHIKKFLRQYRPIEHWHVTDTLVYQDTFHALKRTIPLSPEEFLEWFGSLRLEGDETYVRRWHEAAQLAAQRHEEFISQAPFTDLTAYHEILTHLVDPTIVHMGNSTVVRYFQLYPPNPRHRYFANRGVSGIDGCSSTAVGHALVSGQPNILFTGDLAFGYDANAFWLNQLPDNLRIVVFDNGGGSIFRFIEGPDTTPQYEPYFVTPHPGTVEGIVRRYHLPHFIADSEERLLPALHAFLRERKPCPVLHVKTDGAKNMQILRRYFRHLQNPDAAALQELEAS